MKYPASRYIYTNYRNVLLNPEISKQLKKLKHIVYILITDGDVSVLGTASSWERCKVIFPGLSAPGHCKAFTAALSSLVAVDVDRIIIQAQNIAHAAIIEKELFQYFNFFHKTVNSKNDELFLRRLEQLGIDPDSISSQWKDRIVPIIYPTGCEMAGFKGVWMQEYEKNSSVNDFKQFRIFVHKLFGGYFKDV